MRKIPIYFLLLCFAAGCAKPKPTLGKAWMIDDGMTTDEISNISEYLSFTRGGLTTASFLDLQADGNFHANLFAYDYGKWSYNKNILTLSGRLEGPVVLYVNKLTEKQLILTDPKQNSWYCFKGNNNQFTLPADNPFAMQNNFWRRPARSKESDSEISSRLRNHFQFWEKYFNWGNKEHVKPLNIGAVPSLLQMYGNGFELTFYDYQPMSWVKLFYDTADCYKAYEKMYGLFATKKIKWPKTKDRFENLASAFRQLQAWVDEKQKLSSRN